MPALQSKKQRRKARARRRRLIMLTAVLAFLLACLLIAIALLAMDDNDPNALGQTEPALELALPEGVTLLTPTIPDSVDANAQDFVSGLEGTGITVAFAQEPEAKTGEQSVSLLFSDGSAHCTRQTVCYRFGMELSVVVDVTENRVADIRDFVTDDQVEASLKANIVLDTIGKKTVTVLCGENAYEVQYIVKESNPPEGTPCDITAQIGTVPDPAMLVHDIADQSEVTVSYKETPKLSVAGDLAVTLVLMDAFGNATELDSVIHVIPAENAPKFEGLTDLKICLGDTVSYKKGVEAVDPQDGSVSFTVDAALVNRDQEGTYIAYYSATDCDGNTTIVPRKVIVQSMDQAKVEDYIRGILDNIITEDMSRDQQIKAVYKYSKNNIQYVGTSNKESIWASAYEGLTTGKGDCYTYYAVNRLMLDLLGIENLEVRRTGGTSNHWWNLVLHEDGVYYHVDSCPVAVKVERVYHGKMTESDLLVYTNHEGVVHRRPNFYIYDHTLPEYEGIEIAL